jgi:hypothetical protein
MNDKNQNSENPTPQTQPLVHPTAQANPKFIQPSAEFMQYIASDKANKDDETPRSSVTYTSNNEAELRQCSEVLSHKPNSVNRRPSDNIETDNKPRIPSFKEGYVVGGKIFWVLIVLCIVMNLILFGAMSLLSKTINVSSYNLILLPGYFIMLLTVVYATCQVLKTVGIEDVFWLTIFGIATKLVVIVACLVPAFIVLAPLLFLTIISGGVGATLVSFIASFIISYLLTKLSWGIAFYLFGKIENKVIIMAIDIIFIIAIACSFIFYGFLIERFSKITGYTGNNTSLVKPSSNLGSDKNASNGLTDEIRYSNYEIVLSDGSSIIVSANSLWGSSSNKDKLIREIDGINYVISFIVGESRVDGNITLSLDPMVAVAVELVDSFTNPTGTYYIAKTNNNSVVLSACKPDEYGLMCSVRLNNKINLLVELNTYEKSSQSDLDIDFSKPSSKNAIRDFVYISKNLKINVN